MIVLSSYVVSKHAVQSSIQPAMLQRGQYETVNLYSLWQVSPDDYRRDKGYHWGTSCKRDRGEDMFEPRARSRILANEKKKNEKRRGKSKRYQTCAQTDYSSVVEQARSINHRWTDTKVDQHHSFHSRPTEHTSFSRADLRLRWKSRHSFSTSPVLTILSRTSFAFWVFRLMLRSLRRRISSLSIWPIRSRWPMTHSLRWKRQ